MRTRPDPGSLVVGAYAWLATILFGGALVDVVVARGSMGEAAASESADFLLAISAVTILAGIAAAWACRELPVARVAILASLALVALQLAAPAILGRAVQELQRSGGTGVGPALRLASGGLASLLGFVGLVDRGRSR